MPLSHVLHQIDMPTFILLCEHGGGARLLDQIEEYYRDDQATSPILKRRITGEITLARSFLYFKKNVSFRIISINKKPCYAFTTAGFSILQKRWLCRGFG
jgi:hypothetical protein